jgi:hypothetical protein
VICIKRRRGEGSGECEGRGRARLWAACMLGGAGGGSSGAHAGVRQRGCVVHAMAAKYGMGHTYHGRESRLPWKVSLCRAYTIVEFGRLSVSSDDAGRGHARAGVGQGCGPRACWGRNWWRRLGGACRSEAERVSVQEGGVARARAGGWCGRGACRRSSRVCGTGGGACRRWRCGAGKVVGRVPSGCVGLVGARGAGGGRGIVDAFVRCLIGVV